MQSGTHREVNFTEPDIVSDVELRVHCDDSAETAASPLAAEHSCAAETNQSPCSESTSISTLESTAESTAESKSQGYQAFSERFGSQDQASRRSFALNWESQIKQPFNTAYFTVATAAIAAVCIIWNLPVLWLVVTAFGVFALAAFRAAWNNRAHPADFAINLSQWTRRSLRAGALLLPIPFFAILLAQPMAYDQLREGQQLFRDGKYKDALGHFNFATTLNPRFEEAYMELADCYNFTYEYKNSLTNAEKALQLDPTDGAAWASKAWALNSQDKYAEALPAALKAVNFAPDSGQANHALADAYFNLGQYDLAIAPATRHIQIHDTESGALELRADIFEKLGRAEEAARDRTAAANLDSQNSK